MIKNATLLNTDGAQRINDMAIAVEGLSKKNALLALSTAHVSKEDQKVILVKAGLITAEESDAVATTADTVAKSANLTITELLTAAWAKLNAVISANPFKSFLVVTIALGVAIGKLADRIYNAEKYAQKTLDKSAEKVDDVKSEVESINSELQTNQDRIDELNAKENLTLVEQEELDRLKETNAELERELRLKQYILSEEQKEANKDAKKYFTSEKDSLKFESSYEGVEIHEQTDYIGTVEERIEKLQQYADGQIKLSEETFKTYKDYVESALSDFMEEDDYLVEGQDDGLLKRLDALYEKYDVYTNGKAKLTENTIRDILAKVDFQSASKQLEELGKSGELSVTTLSSQFPELIEYLDKAGVSAEELYQYIMALSNPDAINYNEVEKQFKDSLGLLRDGSIKRGSDMQIWNDVQKSFEDENWDIVLNAYLKVKDQYGDHPEGWNADDWISNIQSELDGDSVGVETDLSFSDAWDQLKTSTDDTTKDLSNDLLELAEKGRLTVDTFNEADSTGYFKNLGISAEEAVTKINALADESKQLSSMSDQISKMSEALAAKQENGYVDADTLSGFDVEVRGLDSWDKFQTVLGSTTSSYEECQDAANALATEWVNSSDFLTQLTEDTKEYYATQLEDMGVENYEEVIDSTLALKEAKEALADMDLSEATDEEIQNLISEGKYSALVQEQIWGLYAAKLAEQATAIDSSSDCQQFLNLANDANLTAESIRLLTELMSIYSDIESGVYDKNSVARTGALAAASSIKAQIEKLASGEGITVKPDLKINRNGGKKSGGSSGSSKDLYKEKYEQELKELERMHDLGLISDAEYWQERLDLNEKYFGESSGMHEKYLDEYQENEEDILKGIKDLWKDYYDDRKNDLKDLISYAEKLYDREIDSLEENIKQIEEKRDTEEKYWKGRIDAIGDEINSLEDANDERERAIDLQEKQYQLQKAMHQRTILLYSEDKGMHYVNDTKAERDAKTDLDDAVNDNKIADLKKQQEDLQDQLDVILETYDSQIESINIQIDRLKEVKSAWSDIVENQEFKELEERLKSLFGDDIKGKILSGNTDFINSVISQYSSTSDMLRTIEDATLADIQNMVAQYGVLPENLVPISNAAADIANTLGSVDTSCFNANMDNTANASSNAAEKVQNVTTALNDLSNDVSNYQMPALNTDNFTYAFTEDGGILTALNGFMERYKEICDGIPEIWNNSLAEAFGEGGGTGDPLAGGLANDTKYDALFEPMITALDNCKTIMEDKLKECLETFTTFQTDLSGIIGVGGGSEDSGASQSGANGGKGKGSGGEKKSGGSKQSESGGGSDTIVGAIVEGGGLIDQALNGEENSWSASFITAKDSIHETATSIVDCIESMVETVVNACIKAIEAINMLARADDNNPNNPTPSPYGKVGHAHGSGSAHAEGTAKFTGDWEVQSNESNALVGEVGRELIVRNGKYFTVGDNGAEMVDIKKGDIVFNHEQTESLLKNGYISGRGKAYADGTVGGGKILTGDGTILYPLQPGDHAWEVQKAFEPLVNKIISGEMELVNTAMFEHQRQMEQLTKQINYVNSVTNNRNVQPSIHIDKIEAICPGVTEQQVAEHVGSVIEEQLNKQFSGFHNYTDQRSRIR